MSLNNVQSAWSGFWFSQTTGRALSTIRILFGTVVVMKMIGLYNIFQFEGFNIQFPRHQFSRELTYRIDGFRMPYPGTEWLPTPTYETYQLIELLILLFAVMWTIGFLTRFSGIALSLLFSYLFFLSQMTYHHHTWQMMLVLIVLSFADTSRYYSVAQLLFKKRSKKQSEVYPLRLLQILVTIIYFFAASSKLSSGWLSGDIMRILLRGFKNVPWLREVADELFLYQIIAFFTIATMYILAFVFWHRRWKWLGLIIGIILHIIIESTVRVGTYSYQMWVIYLAFFYEELDRNSIWSKVSWQKLVPKLRRTLTGGSHR